MRRSGHPVTGRLRRGSDFMRPGTLRCAYSKGVSSRADRDCPTQFTDYPRCPGAEMTGPEATPAWRLNRHAPHSQERSPMSLDPVLLSRLQWAWVIAWHIMLPAFTVGLASYIAVLEGLYFFTGAETWFRIAGFWTRIFAVSFGM